MATKTKKKAPAKTTTSTKGNTKSAAAQQQGKLVKGGGAGRSSAKKKKKKAKKKTKGDPVSIATGFVVDRVVDLALPGPIPVSWERTYSSGDAGETTPLGKSGWTHGYHQWIERQGDVAILHDAGGDETSYAIPAAGERTFNRATRTNLIARPLDTFEVHALGTRLIREFAPLVPGGPSMLRAIRDRSGNRIDLVYTGGKLSRIVDAAKRELRIGSDARGRIVAVDVWARGAMQIGVRYEHSSDGDLETAIDVLGNRTSYAYDGKHRLVRRTIASGLRFHYAYDPDTDRCIKTWGDGGLHRVEFTYDLEAHTTTTHGELEPRIFQWDDQGNVLGERTFDGAFLLANKFDEDGYPLEEKNAAGEAYTFEYDEHGNCTAITDPAGDVTRVEFVDDEPARRTGPDGLVTTFTQNAEGALIGITYPSGLAYELVRDDEGKLVTVQGPAGRLAFFEYDDEHNLVHEINGLGGSTRYVADALGRTVERRDSLGRMTQVAYDAGGHPIEVVYPDGTQSTLAYDALGNLVRIVDAAGNVTRREYGLTGSLLKLIEPDGQTWQFGYDTAERLLRVTNPKEERHEYSYDRAGRVRQERTFDGRTLDYKYSRAGRLARVEYPDETWRSFQYDPLGNLVEEDSPHGTITLERGPFGRLLRATVHELSGDVVTSFERDDLGRVIAETQDGRTIKYAYDALGRRCERTLPDGSTTRYAYDLLGHVLGIDHDGRKLSLERDAFGREVGRHVERGHVDIRCVYDSMGRLSERLATAPGDPEPFGTGLPAPRILSQRAFSYDAMGRITHVADVRWGPTSYHHDVLGQLLGAQGHGVHEVFDYDVAGSLCAAPDPMTGKIGSWTVDQGNRLRRTPDTELEFDENGRLTSKTHLLDHRPTGEKTEYIWDCRDRLREVVLPGGERVRYTYDAFGRRVRKEISPPPTAPADIFLPAEPTRVVTFLWDGNSLASEEDSERGVRRHVFEPGGFVPVLQQEGDQVFAVVTDHLGVPKELIDEDGRVAWTASHNAWGEVVAGGTETGSDVESPFRLLGHYHDDETELGCTRFRYFDAAHGRWLSPDPIGLHGGKNLYGFIPSPVIASDPLGLSTKVMYYHATTKQFEAIIRATGIDVAAGRTKVDFHQGFYVTTDEQQALQWANRPKNNGLGVVLAFEVDPADLAALNKVTYPGGDAAWEARVIAGRQGLPPPAGVDIMEGPMLLNPDAVVDPNTGAVLGATPAVGGQQTTILTPTAAAVLFKGIQ